MLGYKASLESWKCFKATFRFGTPNTLSKLESFQLFARSFATGNSNNIKLWSATRSTEVECGFYFKTTVLVYKT